MSTSTSTFSSAQIEASIQAAAEKISKLKFNALLSSNGSLLRDVPHPTHFQCMTALYDYPLALQWAPVEFQTLYPICVEAAILKSPVAIVFDRRPKSIVKTFQDLMDANLLARGGDKVTIVHHLMIVIQSKEGQCLIAQHARLQRVIIEKLREFIADNKAVPILSVLRETLQIIEAIAVRSYLAIHPCVCVSIPAIPAIPQLRRSARIASRK